MTDRETLKLALELHAKQYPHMQKGYTVDAITALRQALEQEPCDTSDMAHRPNGLSMGREWQNLTDEEIESVLKSRSLPYGIMYRLGCRAIEAKLKEKNT